MTFLSVALAGCGGRKVVPNGKPIDMTIPADLAKAFEVKELPAPTPAPTPAPVVAKEKARKKKSSRHHRRKGGEANPNEQAGHEAVSVGMTGPGAAKFEIPNRRPAKDPIWVGEKIEMDVTWLNTKAGEFELEVLPFKQLDGRKVYDFKGSARTSELFSLVYRADDWVESFVDYFGWFPYKFTLHGDESKHVRNNVELFDHAGKKQYVATYDNRLEKGEVVEEKGVKDLTPFTQDSLSAIYYVRTFPFEVGKTIRFPLTTNGHQWDAEVSVLAREEVATKMGFRGAFKCKIETRFKGELQQQGDAFMWFSDDDRHFLLRFEAKVRIGWINGITKSIEPGSPESAADASATGGSGVAPTIPGAKSGGQPTSQIESKDWKSSANSGVSRESDASPAAGEKPKYRPWFHWLMESVSGVSKKSE